MNSKIHPFYNWIDVFPNGKIMFNNKFRKFSKTNNGYLRTTIKYKTLSLHRLVAETFVPNPESKPEVHHKDEDKLNNHFSNLQWVTKKEHNKIHFELRSAVTSKLMKDNKHRLGKFKISNQTVNQIKGLLPLKTNAEIHRITNVSRVYIGLIRKGKAR